MVSCDDPATAVPVPDGLEHFSHPAQFTEGEHSPPFFRASTRRVAALLPHAEVTTIEGGAHAAMLDHPARYNAVLTDFIERTRASAALNSP